MSEVSGSGGLHKVEIVHPTVMAIADEVKIFINEFAWRFNQAFAWRFSDHENLREMSEGVEKICSAFLVKGEILDFKVEYDDQEVFSNVFDIVDVLVQLPGLETFGQMSVSFVRSGKVTSIKWTEIVDR